MYMRPPTMTTDTSTQDGNHMRVIEIVLPTKLSKICDWASLMTIGINKTSICFNVVTLTYTIFMRPAFM